LNYETTREIEVAIANWFDIRRHIVVPNVSWGMFGYELDLCVLNTTSMCAKEVEIKVSKSDLKRDADKYHHHDRNGFLIKELWFAMPEKMRGCEDLVPERAGILFVTKNGRVLVERKPTANKLYKKWSEANALKLARLGAMRVWALKQMVNRTVELKKELKEANEDARMLAEELELEQNPGYSCAALRAHYARVKGGEE